VKPRDTQGTHTGHAGAQRHTDHADEPHNHPNPPTTHIPHVSATTEAAAARARPTQQPQARSRPLNTRYTGTGSGEKTPGGDGTRTGHTCAQGHTDHTVTQTNLTTIEPSLQPTNVPTRHKHDRTTTETAADSTAATHEPTAPRGRLRKGRPQRIP